MLGVTSQTPFTYLPSVNKDLNFVRGGGGGGGKYCYGHVYVYECVLQVSSKFHTKTREKGEVSQNHFARIVDI